MRSAIVDDMRKSMLAPLALLLVPGAAFPKEAPKPPADPNAATLIAEMALKRGECRVASEQYAAVAGAKGASEESIKRALEVALECQQYPLALGIARDWRAKVPKSADAARMEAAALLRLGRNDDARSTMQAAAKLGGLAPSANVAEFATLAEATDNYFGTYRALRNIVEIGALDAPALVTLGDLALDSFVFADAQDLGRKAVAKDANHAPAHALLARALVSAGKTDEALGSARAAQKLDPKDHSFMVADVLIAGDRSEEAHRELERLQEDDDVGPEAERRIAILAYREGDYDSAAEIFSQRARTGDGAGEALFYLASVAQQRGSDDIALALYGRLVQSGAGMLPRARAASLLMKAGKREEALALLDEYAEADPATATEVILTKGSLLMANDAAADAVALLESALDLYPGHPGIEYQYALALERAGRIDDSIAVFARMAKARQNDPATLNALGYTMADHDRSLREAAKLIDEAIALSPDNPAILDSQGWVHFKRGDAKAALGPLERAWSISHDTEIAGHWGEVLWSLGRESEARAVWARALARDPDSQVLKKTIARFVK